MLGVAGVDQDDLEATLVEDFEGRDPVNTRGLHGHRAHAAVLEPVRQPVQVAGERSKTAHRLGVLIGPDCGHVQRGADVNCGRMGVGWGNIPLATLFRLEHSKLSYPTLNGAAGLCLMNPLILS